MVRTWWNSLVNPGASASSAGGSLGNAMSWSGAGSALSYTSTVLGNVLIARALAPSTLGQLSYLVWLLGAVSQLLPLSAPYAASIYVGAYLGCGDTSRARTAYFRGLWITGGLAALGALAWLVAGPRWMPETLHGTWPVALAVVFVAAQPLRAALQGWAAAGMNYRAVALGDLFGAAGFVVGAAAAWFMRSAPLALAAYAARQLLTALWWMPTMFRITRGTEPRIPTNAQAPRDLRLFWPLALEHWIMLVGYVFVWSRSELALLNWLGTSVEVAQFNVAAQFSGPVQMATTLFTAPLALYAARKNTPEGRVQLAGALGSILRLSRVVSGGAALVASALAPVAVPLLFGSAYAPAARVVPLLAFAAWVYAQVSVYSALSHGLERPRYSLASMGVGGLVLLAVGVPLVPGWGALGAALARLATQGVSLLLLWFLVSRVVPGVMGAKQLLRGIVVFGLPLMAMSGAMTHLVGKAALAAGLLLAAGAVVAVRWLGLLEPSDLQRLVPRLQRLPRRANVAIWTVLGWLAT